MIIRSSFLYKFYFVGVLFAFGNTSLFAQRTSNFIIKNSLTLNWQEEIGVIKGDLSYATVYDTSHVFDIVFVNPSVMFGANVRGHHEIELSSLGFSNKEVAITRHLDSIMQQGLIQHFDERIFQLGLGYFYNHRFSSKPKPLEFYLGVGVSYTTTSTAKIPVSEQIYPWFTRKSNRHQLDVLLRPKILYQLSDSFVLDINAGISLFQYYIHSYTNEGTIFTTEPERVTVENDDFFAELFRISVGIGYKI